MDQYAVFGNPIAHSKSPQIHAAFAAQTGQYMQYNKQLVEAGQFDQAAAAFRAAGGKGFNVTVPFKEEACQWVDELDPLAQQAGAVNTIALADGKSRGYNTDGLGLVRDLTVNHAITLAEQQILILGAGGAVRGVLAPLLKQHPACITIANRTEAKAQALAKRFAEFGQLAACGYAALAGQQFDIIINGTSTGLSGELPPIPAHILRSGGSSYDMMYASEPTAFVRWGVAHGAAQALDGLGMLVEQAAEAFAIWRGVRPDTRTVIQQLR